MLYVGSLDPGGTCIQRMNALQDLGHTVIPVDVRSFLHDAHPAVDWVRRRLLWSPGIKSLNRFLTELAVSERPDLLWVDKGVFLHAGALRRIRAGSSALLVHYNPDDPFGGYGSGWRLFLEAVQEYDVHLVPRSPNVEEYRRLGAREVIRFRWAFDRNVHRPAVVTPADRLRFGGPVGFIGDFENERAAFIRFLGDRGIPVRVWGPNWRHFRGHGSVRVEGRPLWNSDYRTAICSFDINLGFLRQSNRDQSTTRSVEIPACGGFLLAERTREHLDLFEEGKEAEFFDTPNELLEKITYYLAHDLDRRRIATAGRERCLRSGWSYHDELSRLLIIIQRSARASSTAMHR
jgi:hypothetical protein